MDTYNIEITEVLQRLIRIEANSKEEAIKLAKGKYQKEEIVLDYNDFVDVNIKNV